MHCLRIPDGRLMSMHVRYLDGFLEDGVLSGEVVVFHVELVELLLEFYHGLVLATTAMELILQLSDQRHLFLKHM